MRSCLSHFRRNMTFLSRIALAVLFLAVLAGCSNGGGQAEVDQSEAEAEISQLKDENEKLHTELDETNDELKTAEARVKELEHELETMREAQAAPSPAASAKVEITPPERTRSELLLGLWYFQKFQEEGVWSCTQSLIFNADGTGTINQTYYIPKDEVENVVVEVDDDGTLMYLLSNVDMSDKFSWSLDGDDLRVDIDEEQHIRLIYTSEQELTLKNGNGTYGRAMPAGMEGYVERALYSEDFEAKEAARRRRFLGTWYYDVVTWTFNEDGTGVWDIPEVGDQPAEKREFTYSVDDDGGTGEHLCLTIDWNDLDYWMLFPTFNADGSMAIRGVGQSEPVMTWTRVFDPDNCPITAQIISNGIGVISGRMFYDMLGIEE